MPMREFIKKMPKAELHLHIEGTLEPELLFSIAKRNRIKIKYPDVSALRRAYNFSDLQDFLDIYYEGCNVLRTKKDFYEMTFAYFKKAHENGIAHAEIFFDPQSHTSRGVPFATVMGGIRQGCLQASKKFGISSKIIVCFLRHLSEKQAEETLRQAIPYRKWIEAVGLDSSEKGNPPSKFARVFAKARKAGFRVVAHAGEEGPAGYVSEAVNLLGVERIDHGNHALDDLMLLRLLARKRIPLTMCPLSNLKLRVVKNLKAHPLKRMMDAGLLVTVNSDDPAYFGGYLVDNYLAVQKALGLTHSDLAKLAKNSFEASFLPETRKRKLMRAVDGCMEKHARKK